MIKATHYSLQNYNTFGFPVSARYFFEYDSVEQLKSVLPEIRRPILNIGKGSNLLFLDNYNGTVLHSAIDSIEVVNQDYNYVYLKVGSGVIWDNFVEYTVTHNWWGAENLSYIPGMVGASAVQNVGAYGVEASDIIYQVEAVDIDSLETVTLSNEDCRFAYRFSAFKAELKDRYVITYVTFKLSKKARQVLTNRSLKERFNAIQYPFIKEIRNAVIEIRRSKLPEVSDLGSAGSFFKNPIIDRACLDRLLLSYPSMPWFAADNGMFKLSAGWLLETAGWRGYRSGHVGVFNKHALILVHYGGGTGRELLELVENIQKSVVEKFGIKLEPEVIFIE